MFERFTDRARRVVVLAQEEARLLDHNYIGTEHVLLGLVHEGEGVAATALQQLGIDLQSVRIAVEEIIGRGGTAPEGHVPFTPRAKKVLELALREAMQLGHNYIGTEHILLGLLREGEGVGAQVLVRFGADLAQVRTTVVALLAGYSTGEARVMAPRSDHARLIAQQATVTPREACLLCGRDLWEVDRYVEGAGGAICDLCATGASRALDGSGARTVLLPPRVLGEEPNDPDAPAAIQEAFSTVFRDGDVAHRVQFLEDGEALAGYMRQLEERFPGPTSVQVSELRFTNADDADVRYIVQHPLAPGRMPYVGRAIQRGGRWLVSRETYASAVSRGGVVIPPRAPER
jgi:ATP-dependent Clp protease ATP-binding subunit ClpC